MELRLNTECLRVAFLFESRAEVFCLRAMPKLIIQVYPFKRYVRMEGSRSFNVVSRFLLITPYYPDIDVDASSHLYIVVRKKPTPIFSRFNLIQAGLK